MDGKDFKKELANPKNIYCLVSTDAAMIDLYVERFKNAIHADEINYGSIRPRGKLFKKITLNVINLPKLNEEIFNRTEYIFIYINSIDKRSSIYKKYKNQIIELKNDYTDFIKKHSNLSDNDAKEFAKRCNNDLGIIKNNLILYNLSDCSYKRFSNYNSDVFNWVEQFIKKDRLPKVTESPISILALLSTNCQNLLKVKSHDTKSLNPYIAKCLMPLCKCRTDTELYNIISDCFYLDCQLKKGLIDINDIIPYMKAKYL